MLPQTLDTLQVINWMKLSYTAPEDMLFRKHMDRSRDFADLLRSIWDMDTIELVENAYVLYLTGQNKVIGASHVGLGQREKVFMDPKVIFPLAMLSGASRILLAHNHPYGDPTPSAQDKFFTRRIKIVGNILQLPILDHIILTRYGYYSMADEGDI